MRAPLLKVFLARYVLIAEVAGYLLAGTLITLWAIFFFIRVDEHCFGQGTAKPATLEIAWPASALVERKLAENEQWVTKDQAILLLNQNPKAVAAVQAQNAFSSLGQQIVTLADDATERKSLQDAMLEVNRRIGVLETGRDIQEIRAPADGLLHLTTPSTTTLTIVQGKLGEVISDKTVQIEVALGQMNRERVAVDQPAKIVLRLDPDSKEKFEPRGKVVKMIGADKALVEAPLGPAEDAVSKRLSELVTRPGAGDDAPKAEVKIVVGNKKMVQYLFQKSAPPPKVGKKKAQAEGGGGKP